MRTLILLILLAFPVVEVVLLFDLAARYGWWLLLYLAVSATFGAMLIMEERMVVFARLIQALQEGGHPLLALLGSARKMIAGLLFILPGVLSDIAALLLLLGDERRRSGCAGSIRGRAGPPSGRAVHRWSSVAMR